MTIFEELLETSYSRELTIDDFGGIPALAQSMDDLVGHPLLIAAAQAIDAHVSKTASGLPNNVATALHTALRETESPSVYRDTADYVLDSAELLAALGSDLADSSLAQGAQPSADATPSQTLRAADALEIAVQLRLRDYANRWDLFGCLDSYDAQIGNDLDGSYSRAVLRATVACVEQWNGTDDLIPIARRIAGLESAALAETSGGGGEERALQETHLATTEGLSDADTGLALARIATLQALRAVDRIAALHHLDIAARTLAPALVEDHERPDIAFASDIVTLLRGLLIDGTIGDAGLIDRISENVRELIHLDPGRKQWVRDRSAASRTAWAQLARQLADAHQHLDQPSWYHAAAITDSIVALYRTTSSASVYRRTDDDAAVHAIIAPTLEHGFATQASLLRHLQEHVDWLQTLADRGESTQTQLDDLPVAIRLRDAANEQFNVPHEIHPKDRAGAPERATGATPADQSESEMRVATAVEHRRLGAAFTLGTLVADDLLERAHRGFAGSPDYTGVVEEATDLVAGLLIRFLWDRNQLGESDVPYLYREDASEADLADDLHRFLRGSGSLGTVTTEIRRIAGGRVDIQFGFTGFNLYVELKVDSTKIPVPDKKAYLGQAASYTVVDQRIGFLVVLKLLPAKRALAPHLSDCLDVLEVIDASGQPRHIAALTLAGARTKPSDM